MPTNNAGEVIPDPAERRRELGRVEDLLRADLDLVARSVADLANAYKGAREKQEKIGEIAEELGLDRSRPIGQAESTLARAERDLKQALGLSTQGADAAVKRAAAAVTEAHAKRGKEA